jgi:hypothetical protein
MIDGFKILNLPVSINELLKNNLLDFPLSNLTEQGEITNKNQSSNYQGLIFTINKTHNSRKLRGSFHKYFNDGIHNYNDFTFENIVTTVIDLCKKININPYRAVLNNLEFGVNVIVPFDIKDFLKSIISYNGTPFQLFNIEGAMGIECLKNDFIIKFYNKSLQYDQHENILRFEIKVKSMKFFKDKKIKLHTLSDLLTIDIYPQLASILKSYFNDIHIYDNSIDLSRLSTDEQIILSNGCNHSYWERINPKSKDYPFGNKDHGYKSARKKYNRGRGKYKSTYEKYSTSTIRNDFALLIENKCKELILSEYETGDKLPDFLKCYSDKEGDKLPDHEYTHKGQISILDIVRICTHEDKKKENDSSSYLMSIISPIEEEQFDTPEATLCLPDKIELSRAESTESEHGKPLLSEEVLELLDWSESHIPPTCALRLDQCTTIIDCKVFVQSAVGFIRANGHKRIYQPYIDRLVKYKEVVTKN